MMLTDSVSRILSTRSLAATSSGCRWRVVLLLSLLLAAPVAVPAAPPPEIRAVVLRNSPPLQFFDPRQGHAAGFAVDVLTQVASRADCRVTYVFADTWAEMIERLRSGQVDVIASLAISDERRRLVAFTRAIDSSPISLFVRAQDRTIKGLAPGLTVGTIQGSIVVEVLRIEPQVDIRLYKSIAEGLFDLLAGRIDAFATGDWLILREARNAGIEDRIRVAGEPLLDIKRAMAVRQGDAALLARLDGALAGFTRSAAYRDIYIKWYGKPSPYWTAAKILLLMSALLVASSIVLIAWRYRTVRRLNLALRVREKQLRQAMDATSDGLWDWDVVSGEAYYNPNYYRMLGYEPGEFPASYASWEERVHPDDRTRALATIAAYLDNRSDRFEIECRMQAKNGEWKWILGRGEATERSPEGKALRMIGTHVDISDRKRAEAALKEALREAEAARERVDAILESVSDALVVTDRDNRIMLMNKAAEKFLGHRLAEACQRPLNELLREPVLEELLDQSLAGAPEGQSVNVEMHHAGLGEMRFVQAHASPVLTGQGERAGVVTTLRDITREREVDRIKSEFISIAAHELRTPLASVIGYADLLLDEQLHGPFTAEQKREYLSYIMQKGEVLGRIVDDLLNLSRIESGRPIVLEQHDWDLAAIIRALVPHHQRETGRHRFIIDLPAEPVVLSLDRSKIEQVIDNLLNNAVKYSPAGGAIRISGRREESGFQVSVADQGVGMTAEQAARIFDKFYRADTMNTAVSGLGLGLSIARSIVEAHGGSIWVASEPGRGTRISFRLPATTEATA